MVLAVHFTSIEIHTAELHFRFVLLCKLPLLEVCTSFSIWHRTFSFLICHQNLCSIKWWRITPINS
jgi:hypothetical protein